MIILWNCILLFRNLMRILKKELLLLLDIEKAFDSVSWEFLFRVMDALSFPDSLISWLRVLYHRKEIRVLNNGHASSPIFSYKWGGSRVWVIPLIILY